MQERLSYLATFNIDFLVLIAQQEGDPAAVDAMVEILRQMAMLIQHVGGHDRLTSEVGNLCLMFNIGGDEPPPAEAEIDLAA